MEFGTAGMFAFDLFLRDYFSFELTDSFKLSADVTAVTAKYL